MKEETIRKMLIAMTVLGAVVCIFLVAVKIVREKEAQDADNPLSWKVDRIEEDTIYFCNGIQVILPENYRDKVEIERYEEKIEDGYTVVWICEKQNHEAGYGGGIWGLRFWKKEPEMKNKFLQPEKFLGVYSDEKGEYALLCGPTREGAYIEELKQPWVDLKETVDEIQVVTSEMEGFEECGIEEVDWVECLD